MHSSHHMGASRFRCPAHTGATQAIREALARAGEPLSVYRLQLATGMKPEKIRAAISQMINRTGSIVSIKMPRGVVYALYVPRESKPRTDRGSGQIAGRIVYPGFVYGASRLE